MNSYNGRRVLSHSSWLLRHLSTATAQEVVSPQSSLSPAKKAKMRCRLPVKELIGQISAIGATGRRVADVLHYCIREAIAFTKEDLINCLRNLRKVGRYQHCYEILQWLEKSKYNYSSGDYALHLDIVSKFKGVTEAEKYFGSLPAEAKNQETYSALLNCYCKELMADKAAACFEEMNKLKLVSPLAFNNIMGMSLRLGQPEKVPGLIQEMKDMNHPVKRFSSILLMQAYLMMNDIEGVEKVFKEIKENNENYDWAAYSNLANAYIKAGISDKAELALKELEDLLKTKKSERTAYHYLISFYATTCNSDAVHRVWDLLMSYYPFCHNMSYLCLLQAISKLDKVVDLEKFFQEWSTNCQHYDPRIPTLVIRAYLSHNLSDKAEQVFETASGRAKSPFFMGHEFIAYYLKKGDIDSALRHMEKAVALVKKDKKWQPKPKMIASFFKHFEKERDADGAEKFCLMLKKADCLDSEAYWSLLQIYVAVGKTDLEMRKRIQEDGIEISTQLEHLLDKVCPRESAQEMQEDGIEISTQHENLPDKVCPRESAQGNDHLAP
ncbi:hypothetical protein Dimus_032235 [Dionaea muscipula]